MGDPLERPSRGDRRHAVRQVEDAVEAGVIVAADGELRIQQIESAVTNADVQSQVQDLAGRTAPTAAGSIRAEPYGPVSPRLEPTVATRVVSAVGTVRRRHVVPIVIGLVIVGNAGLGVVGGLVHAFSSDHTQAVPQTPAVDMFTAGAYADLLADLRTTTGGTQVARAVMYASYAAVSVADGEQETLYSWRGSLVRLTTTGSTTQQATVDLAAYQPEVVFALIDQAKQLVGSPTTWYVIVQPAYLKDDATIYAYASDSSGAGGYVSAKQDGTVVRTQRY